MSSDERNHSPVEHIPLLAYAVGWLNECGNTRHYKVILKVTFSLAWHHSGDLLWVQCEIDTVEGIAILDRLKKYYLQIKIVV